MQVNLAKVRKVIGEMQVVENWVDDETFTDYGERMLDAQSNGRVFLFSRSLYRDLRLTLFPDQSPRAVPIAHLALPYENIFLLEIDDTTGEPSAAVLAWADGGVVDACSYELVKSERWVGGELIDLNGPLTFYPSITGPAYATIALTAALAVLRNPYSESEFVPPLSAPLGRLGKKKREHHQRQYSGRFTVIKNTVTAPKCPEGHRTGAVVAAHEVRGHFKRRKNGVFWWRPHIAGTGTVLQRTAYIIKE